MALSEKTSGAATNGTNAVTLVSGSNSAKKVIKGIVVHNADTVTATVHLYMVINSVTYYVSKVDLYADTVFIFDFPLTLENDTYSLVIKLGGAHTTTAPTALVSYAEV